MTEISNLSKKAPTFEQFLAAADRVEHSSNQNRTIKLGGPSGAKYVYWKTWKSTNRKAMAAFVASIQKQYGAEIKLGKAFDEIRSQGKPLTARTIREVQQKLNQIDADGILKIMKKKFNTDTEDAAIKGYITKLCQQGTRTGTDPASRQKQNLLNGEIDAFKGIIEQMRTDGIDIDKIIKPVGSSIDKVEQRMLDNNLVRVPTNGDGNCFFYGVVMSLAAEGTKEIQLYGQEEKLQLPEYEKIREHMNSVKMDKPQGENPSAMNFLTQIHKNVLEKTNGSKINFEIFNNGCRDMQTLVETIRKKAQEDMGKFIQNIADDDFESIKLNSESNDGVEKCVLKATVESADQCKNIAKNFKDLPTLMLPFLASTLQRPIVLYSSNNGELSGPIRYDMNLYTNQKMEENPIYLHFGNANDCNDTFENKAIDINLFLPPNHYEVCINPWKE